MPAPVVYPPSLPGPSSLSYQPDERRLTVDKPFSARAMQLDRRAREQATFGVLTAAEAETFYQWWLTTLVRGGALFLSSWPLPQGLVDGVRKFIGSPRWSYVAGGFWNVAADFEVIGRSLPPVIYASPDLAMHFDAAFVDLSGHPMAAYHWTNADVPPSTVTTNPKFAGSPYLVNTPGGGQPLVSDNRGNYNLNEFGEWQVTFFVRPSSSSVYGWGGILALQGNGGDGVSPGLGGKHRQLSVYLSNTGGVPKLKVQYPTIEPGTPSTAQICTLEGVNEADGPALSVNDWTFVAICGDATSTRAYINSALELDDRSTPAYPPGSRPLFYNPSSSFVDQFYVVSAEHTGSFTGDYSTWPGVGMSWSGFLNGGLEDLRVMRGIGAVEYFGTTIVPPTAPFQVA